MNKEDSQVQGAKYVAPYTNRKLRSNNHSGITGVSWDKNAMKWTANIQYKGQSIYLGAFKDLDDAAYVRKQAENACNAMLRLGITHITKNAVHGSLYFYGFLPKAQQFGSKRNGAVQRTNRQIISIKVFHSWELPCWKK